MEYVPNSEEEMAGSFGPQDGTKHEEREEIRRKIFENVELDSVISSLSENSSLLYSSISLGGSTPFHMAAHLGRIDLLMKIHTIFSFPINLLRKIDQSSALTLAATNGHIEVVRYLLHNSADVNIMDNINASPLYMAAQNHHTNVCQVLLSAAADPNILCQDGTTALEMASHDGGASDCVELLLQNGANPNLSTSDWGPLAIACYHSHENIIKTLLDYGANANGTGKSVPLVIAVSKEPPNLNIIELLLRHDANPKLEMQGRSAIAIATDAGDVSLVEMLECFNSVVKPAQR